MLTDSNISASDQPQHAALLVLPRLRVQNANAISSPLTWGFPAMTAFTGLMTALERRLGPQAGITFFGVGVVCHGFEAQVTQGGYTRSFSLTRNPVLQDGSTAAIVEEGRVHLDITLVFDVQLDHHYLDDNLRAQLGADIGARVAGMRIAGGSVMPPLPGQFQRPPRPTLTLLKTDERTQQFRRLSRRWLPGFALVGRDDVLHQRLAELHSQWQGDEQTEAQGAPTLLDAWLDLARLNYVSRRTESEESAADDEGNHPAEWIVTPRPGWLVPMPVGFAALSELHPPGNVAGARDPQVPFQFVESVYSIGQWISPHRLRDINDLMWYPNHDSASGLYRCVNEYQATPYTDHADSSVN